jgi:glucose-6-phosphate-specific signal transduction histidine kinase
MGVWIVAKHKSKGKNGALMLATFGLKVTLLCLVQTIYVWYFKSRTHVMLFMFPQYVFDSNFGALFSLV